MRFNNIVVFLFVVLGLAPLSHATTKTTTTTQSTSDASIENAILVHINAYRQQHGLSALKMDSNMVREARQHSKDMATHKIGFGHQYFANRVKTLHAQVKNSNAGAENVAYNYKNAADVVKNWVRSPGHKTNIEGHYNLTGIGVARDKQGKLYFTQIFLRTGNGGQFKRPLLSFLN